MNDWLTDKLVGAEKGCTSLRLGAYLAKGGRRVKGKDMLSTMYEYKYKYKLPLRACVLTLGKAFVSE